MSSNSIQAQRPKKPSMVRKPTFSLVPPEKATQIHQTSRDAYEEQVKMLNFENSQLKALRHEDLEKYDQLALYTDNLREEKSLLQVKIEAADAQHSRTLKKLYKLEGEVEDKSLQKSDLQEKLNDVSSKLQEKVHSLQSQLLASRQEVSNRDLEIKVVRLELRHALEAKDTASAEQLALAKQLQALEETMSSRGGKFQKEVADLRASLYELQLNLASLQERKDAVESDNEELKLKLEELLRAKEAELNQKCSEMDQKVELGRHSIGELTKECEILRSELQTKTITLQTEKELLTKECENLRSELQTKTISLQTEKESITKECDNLRSELQAKTIRFQTERAGLDSSILALLGEKELHEEKIVSLREASISQMLAALAANKKCVEMEAKEAGLTKDFKELQTAMKCQESCFLTERERLNATISRLLEDKRNLEAELALKISGSNSFFESNAAAAASTSSKGLATGSGNHDRHAASSGVKKSNYSESEKMRKDRRIKAHDERRTHSLWNTSDGSRESEGGE